MRKSKFYVLQWIDRKLFLQLGFTLKEFYKAFSELYDAGTISKEDFYSEEWFEHEPTFYKKYCIILSGNHMFRKSKGNWYRDVVKFGHKCRIPSQYAHLHTSDIMRKCLENRFEYFSDFGWGIFMSNYGDKPDKYEIYMDTEAGFLYVPVKSLFMKDFSIVEDRMLSYWKSYNKDIKYARKVLADSKSQALKQQMEK